MYRWPWVLAVVLGMTVPAAADPPETLRSISIKPTRGRLEWLGSALELVSTLREKSMRQIVDDAIAESPEAQLMIMYLLSNLPKAVVVDVVGTGGGGMTETAGSGDLTAMLRARVTGDYCDLLSGSVAVRASYEAGFAGEIRAAAGFCFWSGLYFTPQQLELETLSASLFPLRANGEITINGAPRFSSLRNAPRRRFSEVKYSFSTEGLRIMPSSFERGFTFIYMGFEQRREWPGLFDGERGFELDGGFGFVRLFRSRAPEAIADRAIDILDVHLHGTQFDESVAIIDLYPVRFRGIGLFSSQVLLDAELGFGGSGGMIGSTECLDNVGCVEEMIVTGPNVAQVNTWIAHGGLSIGTRARAGGVSFVRRLDSNILGQLTLENRTTGWYQTISGPVVARAELFGGSATHYLDIDARGDERFAGASVDLRYQLQPRVSLGIELDAIRTFERDPVLDRRVAGSGARAFATLTFTTDLKRVEVDLDPELLAPSKPLEPTPEPTTPVDPPADATTPDEPAIPDIAPSTP